MKRFKPFIVSCSAILFLSFFGVVGTFGSESFAGTDLTINNENYDTVVSYKDVLRSYYNLATADVENPSKTYDEFYEEFYSEDSDRDLVRFTSKLALENDNYENVIGLFEEADSSSITTFSSKGSGDDEEEDESYILNDDTDYTTTPSSAFKREFVYSAYSYSSLQYGDIVWETITTLKINTGHTALVVNTSQQSDYGKYIQTVEAVASGVRRGFLDDLRMVKFGCVILRVNGRSTMNSTVAVNFALAQLGKPYNLDLSSSPKTSINASSWYCSELIYAAWKYAYINLNVFDGITSTDPILPIGIANSDNTYELPLTDYFLDLSIISKSGNDWTIQITNTSTTSVDVYYNAKMCNSSDAENWTNLEDVNKEPLTISSKGSQNVTISTNWFATSIAACYEKNNYKIITYADNLNSSKLTLTSYNNLIEVKTQDA